MAAWEGKKYKFEKSENFDEYLKALGISTENRQSGTDGNAPASLVKNGDEYEYISTTGSVMKFKPGVEFDIDIYGGQKIRTVVNFETPNKLVMEQKGDKPGKVIREFTNTEMVSTYTFNGVTGVRYYKAI
ncbi:unnamed protein product [Hermetia illucens]|uniref:Cytosolic fatty-acid binding proteins domain-containing protein n=1 Tax=Hermetia illucens TaxID=343691 RepID=A0A7R8Z4T1_HERIL|nr:probable fatty acid-binding protein [Hermetia illucens]CAD7093317.1 unnamed protein product [Hermetia illucens]